jgi:protein-disulfide isomerase
MKGSFIVIALAALVIAVVACQPQQGAGAKKNPGAVPVEFFVMSQCPFGVQVENGIKPVMDKMGPDVDLQINFIGQKDASGNLTSMHGADEVTGDIAQLCAAKLSPATFMDFISCQNKNMKEVAKNWKDCAGQTKIPVAKLESCINGAEGKALLGASFDKAKAKNANGSPTIFIAGKPYNGRRGETDFYRAICAEYKDKKPAACASIPEPAKVNITVLGDKRCTECNTDRYVSMLKFRVANPVLKELDYADADGKKLYDEIKVGNLPVILFDSTLDGDKEAAQMFSRNLRPFGAYKGIVVGEWNPKCMSDGGCALDECKNTISCRKEEKNKLEVFVMSQCPYGVKALNAMEEVLKNFGNKIDFKIHFIADGNAKDGFKGLHGQPEVDENIRELCAIKYYGKDYKYMNYISCRNKDIRSADYEKCGGNGIDIKKIKACFEGDEGKKLLEADLKMAKDMGVGGSPTWLANNKYKFSGIDAETVKSNLCKYNKDLKGCENKLSGDAGAPVQGGCGK